MPASSSTGDVPAESSQISLGPLVALVLLSITLQAVRLLEATPLQSANDRSRWCTVWSLVERGTYRIDEIRQKRGWDTIDKVRHEGHYYSSKPPLLATLVAGLYWSIKHVLGWTLDEQLEWTSRLILIFVNLVPMLLALLVLARLFQRYCQSRWSALFLTATSSFGTLILPFSSTLNNHTIAFVSIVFALQALLMLVVEGRRHWGWFASAGFWSAFACCHELPAAAFGLASFLWLLRLEPRRTLLVFVPFALIPLTAFFYTNYQVTGGLKPFYMYYGTEKYNYVEGGVPSYWMQPKGIDQSKDTPLAYLFHCTLGHHGLLSLSPVLVGVLVGWWRLLWWRRADKRDVLAPLVALGAGLTLLVLGFYLTRTNNYNYGGVSVGLRWMLWLWPFWLLSLIRVSDAGSGSVFFRIAAILCLGIAIFSAWYPSHGPWTQPWLYRLMEQAGWIDYSDPSPAPFSQAAWSWVRQLPETPERDPDYWVEFESPEFDGSGRVFLFRDAGSRGVASRRLRGIEVQIDPQLPTGRTISLWIDVDRFHEGSRIDEFLVWPDGEPDEFTRNEATQLLSGLPLPAEYRVLTELTTGYIRVLARSDAFLATRAAASVSLRPVGHSRQMTYRREIWMSSQVPYGVLQFEDSVRDQRSRAVRGSRMFILRKAGQFFDP